MWSSTGEKQRLISPSTTISHRRSNIPRSTNGYSVLNDQDDKTTHRSVSFEYQEINDAKTIEESEPLKFITFNSDGLDTYYKQIDSYEGAHRYDRDFT